jgi:hypothetical protein
MTRIVRTLHEDKYMFMITSRPFLLRMKDGADKRCRENQNTHFKFINFYRIVPFVK